jgi:hypothetical protein
MTKELSLKKASNPMLLMLVEVAGSVFAHSWPFLLEEQQETSLQSISI